MQRIERRVAEVAAVPVGHAIDLHRLEHRGQAGRGHQVVDREALALEHRELTGPDVGGRNEHAGGVRFAQALEIDLGGKCLAQRVDVERVRDVGARGQHLRPEFQHRVALQRAEHPVEEAALARREVPVEADLAPEPLEPGARALRPTLEPAVDHHHGVHRAGARARHRLEAQAAVLDQRVEDAPGEGAVRAAALKRERDVLLRPRPCEHMVRGMSGGTIGDAVGDRLRDGGGRVGRLGSIVGGL